MSYDVSLLEADGGGRLVAHRTDCPVVQQHFDQERLIFTMLGIEKPLPLYLGRHECLEERNKTESEKET
jgi:hypothetical protein